MVVGSLASFGFAEAIELQENMIVEISTKLEIPAEKAWRTVKKSSTLVFITKGLLGFSQKNFPAEWKEGETVTTRLFLFNFIPAWKHEICFVLIDDNKFELYTNEKGGMVSVWNHLIKIDKANDNSCFYSDKVEIEAGILTPIICFFAKNFYRYRQRRWRFISVD